jgi:hypothetical protein
MKVLAPLPDFLSRSLLTAGLATLISFSPTQLTLQLHQHIPIGLPTHVAPHSRCLWSLIGPANAFDDFGDQERSIVRSAFENLEDGRLEEAESGLTDSIAAFERCGQPADEVRGLN